MRISGERGSFGWIAAGFVGIGLLGGVFLAWMLTVARPEIYTARSSIRVVPSRIPNRFVPATPELSIESVINSIRQDVNSRNGLLAIVRSEDLLLAAPAGMPMEDALKLLRERIEIREETDQTMTILYSDTDRQRAFQVNHAILSHITNETVRRRSSDIKMAVEFVKEQAERAGGRWEALDEQLRKAEGARAARLRLDLDLASRQYENLRQMVSEAETLVDLETRRQGPTVEVADLASVPESPSNMSHKSIFAISVVAGALAGIAAAWANRPRVRGGAVVEVQG